jgi:hypothetical protein
LKRGDSHAKDEKIKRIPCHKRGEIFPCLYLWGRIEIGLYPRIGPGLLELFFVLSPLRQGQPATAGRIFTPLALLNFFFFSFLFFNFTGTRTTPIVNFPLNRFFGQGKIYRGLRYPPPILFPGFFRVFIRGAKKKGSGGCRNDKKEW